MNAALQEVAQWAWQNSFAAAALAVAVLPLRYAWRSRIAPRWLCLAGWLIMLRLVLPAPFANPWAWDRAWITEGKSLAADSLHAMPVSPAPEVNPAEVSDVSFGPLFFDAEPSPAEESGATVVSSTGQMNPPPHWLDQTLTGTPSLPARAENAPAPGIAAGSPGVEWRTVAAWLWLAGAVGFICFTVARHVHFMRRLRRTAVAANSRTLLGAAQECAALAGLRRIPRLVTIPGGGSPFLCGLVRPCVVLPSDPLAVLSTAELRHVLLHEMLHIARLDLAANWLLAAVRALHWWNPFIHVAARRLLADRELLRDHQAVALLRDPAERAAYGHTLLKLALPPVATAPAPSPGLAPLFRSEKELKRRLTMLQSPLRRPRLAATTAAAALAFIAVPVFSTARGQDPENKEKTEAVQPDDSAPSPPSPDKTAAGRETPDSSGGDPNAVVDAPANDDPLAAPPGSPDHAPDKAGADQLSESYRNLVQQWEKTHVAAAGAADEATLSKLKAQEQDLFKQIKDLERRIDRQRQKGSARSGADGIHVPEDVAPLAARYAVLKDLEGERLCGAIFAIDPSAAVVGKMYSEYQLQKAALAACQSEGLGPKHPKVAGLQESVKALFNSMEAAAQQYRASLAARLQTGQPVSGNYPGRATSQSVNNLLQVALTLRKNGQPEEAAAIEKEVKALMSGNNPYSRQPKNVKNANGGAGYPLYYEESRGADHAADEISTLRAEMAEMRKAMADMRQAGGADELRKELARLKNDRQWLEGKRAADVDSRLADIEKALADRTSELLRQKEDLLLQTERERARAKEAEMRARAMQEEAGAMKKKLLDEEEAAKRKAAEVKDAEARARALQDAAAVPDRKP